MIMDIVTPAVDTMSPLSPTFLTRGQQSLRVHLITDPLLIQSFMFYHWTLTHVYAVSYVHHIVNKFTKFSKNIFFPFIYLPFLFKKK